MLSFHPVATYIRLGTLLASGIAAMVYGAAFGSLGLQAEIYTFFAFCMTIFLIYTFLQYSQGDFDHKTKSNRRMLEQSLELAAFNKALHDQQSEIRRLALVARYANDSVIVTDPTGHILWVKEAFTRITGYSREEAIGKRPGTLLDGAIPLSRRPQPLKTQSPQGGLCAQSSSTTAKTEQKSGSKPTRFRSTTRLAMSK